MGYVRDYGYFADTHTHTHTHTDRQTDTHTHTHTHTHNFSHSEQTEFVIAWQDAGIFPHFYFTPRGRWVENLLPHSFEPRIEIRVSKTKLR